MHQRLASAESLERRTKAKGKRDGVIGVSGLVILRALLFHFMDIKSGQLDPSYEAIQAHTGLCVQTIAESLKALARAGLVEIHRRIERVRKQVWNALTGGWQWIVRVVQRTNAYMVNFALPDRQQHGDLSMPLFRESRANPSDSTSQRESTSRFKKEAKEDTEKAKKEAFEGSGIGRTLTSLWQAMTDKAATQT